MNVTPTLVSMEVFVWMDLQTILATVQILDIQVLDVKTSLTPVLTNVL